MVYRPSWFKDDSIMVSTAPTCGLTKGGRLLPLVNASTGQRVQTEDPETGELVDAVDDRLSIDMDALRAGTTTSTLRFVARADVSLRAAVPTFYDRRFDDAFDDAIRTVEFEKFESRSIGELLSEGYLTVRHGHGSPTQSVRVGTVPYIKVSDLRAGLVNINPTNRVPHSIAEGFWKAKTSGLQPWDLLSPARTSKNIGDFCVLLPGQEEVVTTKEILVLRPGPNANFDPFYLIWAMTLNIVRNQWNRVVFMQTNREDVGDRYKEIRIPIPKAREVGERVSEPFRSYYRQLADARGGLRKFLNTSEDHHFFLGTSDEAELEDVENDQALTSPIID